MGETPSWLVTILSSLVALGIAVVKIKKFIVVEEKGSKCSRFNLQLLFTSKGHGL